MTYYDPFTGKPYTQTQMTTPTTGGTNTAGTQPTTTMQPTSIWDTQPKPKNALTTPLVPPLPGDPVGSPNYQPTSQPFIPPTPTKPTSSLPGLPGDTATGGYVDPVTGRWVERNVGIPNPLPNVGPWSGAPGAGSGAGINPLGGRSVSAPGGVPIPGQYQFPGNFSYPAFSYNQVQDYRQNPAYQNQLRESERALNRQLLARGRSDSTGGINALATNQRRLGAEFEQQAYARAVAEDNNNYARLREQNTTEYDRALMMNRLMYDRGYQERITDYEQKFRENERQYGRAKAEEQLAYDRQWNEAARDYAYWKYLVEVGLRASGVPAA